MSSRLSTSANSRLELVLRTMDPAGPATAAPVSRGTVPPDLAAIDPATAPAMPALTIAVPAMTAEQRRHAAAMLELIVATPPTADAPAGRAAPAGSAAPAGTARRRLILGAAAVSATAAGLTAIAVVVPGDVGGGRAYASWTPVPTAATAAEVATVGTACRERLRDLGGRLDLERAQLVLAERRGEYVALLYRTDAPDMSGSCLAHQPPGTDDVDDVRAAVGGGSGPAIPAPARGFTQGALADYLDASITNGAAGTEVAGLTVHAGRLTVQASLRNGRYVAWWPGPAFGPNRDQPSGEGGPQLIISYDLTLTDGTVIRDARSAPPS
jgi:hypothetical protein